MSRSPPTRSRRFGERATGCESTGEPRSVDVGRAAAVRGHLLQSLPIRVKLTLTFVVAMSVVLAATGMFLYLSFRSELSLDPPIRR